MSVRVCQIRGHLETSWSRGMPLQGVPAAIGSAFGMSLGIPEGAFRLTTGTLKTFAVVCDSGRGAGKPAPSVRSAAHASIIGR
jgi:hypothetical protein